MTETAPADLAWQQIQFARSYTLQLLEGIPDDQWLEQPAGCPTHLSWQVGHLAMAQYGLCLFRVRGRQPVDLELMSSTFRRKYSKGTTPDPDPAANPSPDEIRQVFQRVNAQVAEELPSYTEEQLSVSVDMPWSVTPTCLGALYFCAAHEMIHAGQIGLLRRLLGHAPVR